MGELPAWAHVGAGRGNPLGGGELRTEGEGKPNAERARNGC